MRSSQLKKQLKWPPIRSGELSLHAFTSKSVLTTYSYHM